MTKQMKHGAVGQSTCGMCAAEPGTFERFCRFAGVTFRIAGAAEDFSWDDDALADFRTGPGEWDSEVQLTVVDALEPPLGAYVYNDGRRCVCRSGDELIHCIGQVRESVSNAYMQIRRRGSRSEVQILRSAVPERIKPRLVLQVLEAEHFITRRGGVVLHASFICVGGRAILFTAPSGTGKSTQARLWEQTRGARQINGDRTAVLVTEQGILACGIPYSGTSGICENGTYPLDAIVCLSQAPVCEVRQLSGLRAFRSVWEGCSVNTWDAEDVAAATDTVMQLLKGVPVFHLACTPDERAVEALEKAMTEGGRYGAAKN